MVLNLEVVFPIITTTVSLLFTLSLVEQYFRKRKPHQLVWIIALLLFTITAGAEGFSMLMGEWNELVYRLYYVLAAIQVSFMGGGVLYLFASRNVINERNAHRAILLFGFTWLFFSAMFATIYEIFLLVAVPSAIIVIFGLVYWINVHLPETRKLPLSVTGMQFAHFFLMFSLYTFLLMSYLAATSPVNHALLKTGGQVSGLAWQQNPSDLSEMRAAVRLFSPLHTVPGAIALIGGGFYSYISWQLSIKRTTGKFSWKTGIYNVYIAVGALILGQGALLSGFGLPTLYISEVISVILMYFGFLESDKISMQKIVDVLTLKWLRERETPAVSE